VTELAGSKTYPAVRFFLRYGNALAIGVSIALILAGALATSTGHGWGWALAGLLGAPLVYLLLRSYAELVSIIAETLLPR
jgi:hypothetical protein